MSENKTRCTPTPPPARRRNDERIQLACSTKRLFNPATIELDMTEDVAGGSIRGDWSVERGGGASAGAGATSSSRRSSQARNGKLCLL
mgnify:CR=1 FL=1